MPSQGLSKKTVWYTDQGGIEPCAKCQFFVSGDTCDIVEGEISPRGHCVLWSGNKKTLKEMVNDGYI